MKGEVSMDRREMERNVKVLVNCWKQDKLLEYSYISSLLHQRNNSSYIVELMKEVKKGIEEAVTEQRNKPLITHEERMEIVNEWNLIGENDCRTALPHVTELLKQVLDSISEPEKINCGCYVWSEVAQEHVEPNPGCWKCEGKGWYFKGQKGKKPEVKRK
jgi:hypothetical protein